MSILRLLIAVVLIVVVGAFVMGYLSNRTGRAASLPSPTETEASDTVARARDSADRRRVHVRLTSAGVRIREATSVLDPSRVEALLARLTEPERAAAIHGLALLAAAAQRPQPSAPHEPMTEQPL